MMLAPRETPTRERKSLNGLWHFKLDAAGEGRVDEWWRQPLTGSREVPVPASYNDLFPEAGAHDHVGDAWYQTVARVPERWRGERIVLRFDAATHRAVVWVDDTQVLEHEGGYTPFEAEITQLVEPGAEIRITAVVNNVLSWQSIPPGYVEETPDGRRQRYFHDFFNYAGLHRTVWLYTTPASYVSDVTVVTDLNGSTGTVRYEVETAGENGVEVLVDPPRCGGSRCREGYRRHRRGHRRERASLAAGRGVPLPPDRRASRVRTMQRSTCTHYRLAFAQ